MTCALLIIGTVSKSEAVEGLDHRQPGFRQVTLTAAVTTIGNLVLSQRGQEASRRPAPFVELLGERSPHLVDGSQPKIGEERDMRPILDQAYRDFVTAPPRNLS